VAQAWLHHASAPTTASASFTAPSATNTYRTSSDLRFHLAVSPPQFGARSDQIVSDRADCHLLGDTASDASEL
jgi:hypothetical protein